MSGVRVLLTEGSSLTSREVLTCLGPAGHHIEVLDPAALCLARFSRWTRRVHRCPGGAGDPAGYLRALQAVVVEREIDVVLPTHEQAWLLAAALPQLADGVRVAVADADAFAQVQSKLAFAQLLDRLGLPQPAWRTVAGASDLTDLPFPYWLKAAFSTAGQGVREVVDEASRDLAFASPALGASGMPLMAQAPASGQYGQVQGLFDRGRLIAVHTSVQRGTGVGGSAAARLSVDHPIAREHIATIGESLGWHGGLTLDYLHEGGLPVYLECNPRTVEPGNAAASGVNLPDLQVRLTLGEHRPGPPIAGRAGVRTHGTIALLLGAASRGRSRGWLMRDMLASLAGRGVYSGSAEQLTPLRRDPPSVAAAAFVAARLLVSPRAASDIAGRSVASYSVDPDTVSGVGVTSAPDPREASRSA